MKRQTITIVAVGLVMLLGLGTIIAQQVKIHQQAGQIEEQAGQIEDQAGQLKKKEEESSNFKNQLKTRFEKIKDIAPLASLTNLILSRLTTQSVERFDVRIGDECQTVYKLVLAEKDLSCSHVYSTTWGGSTKTIEVSCAYRAQYGVTGDSKLSGYRENENVMKLGKTPAEVISCSRILGTLIVKEDEGIWNSISDAERAKVQEAIDAKARETAAEQTEVKEIVQHRLKQLLDLTPVSVEHNIRWE